MVMVGQLMKQFLEGVYRAITAVNRDGVFLYGTDKIAHRGEIWLADLNLDIGHEQKGKRPALIISDDFFNETRAGIVIVLPIILKDKGISLHMPLTPEKLELNVNSSVKTEDIRAISKERLFKRIGNVD